MFPNGTKFDIEWMVGKDGKGGYRK